MDIYPSFAQFNTCHPEMLLLKIFSWRTFVCRRNSRRKFCSDLARGSEATSSSLIGRENPKLPCDWSKSWDGRLWLVDTDEPGIWLDGHSLCSFYVCGKFCSGRSGRNCWSIEKANLGCWHRPCIGISPLRLFSPLFFLFRRFCFKNFPFLNRLYDSWGWGHAVQMILTLWFFTRFMIFWCSFGNLSISVKARFSWGRLRVMDLWSVSSLATKDQGAIGRRLPCHTYSKLKPGKRHAILSEVHCWSKDGPAGQAWHGAAGWELPPQPHRRHCQPPWRQRWVLSRLPQHQ